jgi:hypothetical protein
MAVLKPGVPVTQDSPHLLVENRLSPGRYRFQLVAIDSSGLESAPAEIVVSVQAPVVADPTPPIRRPVILDRLETLRPTIAQPVVKPVIAEPVKPKINPAILRNINLFKPK